MACPAFVRVVDDRTLAFPDCDGNGMFRSLSNIAVNPHVGLAFVDFQRPRRLRVNGTARLHRDDPLLHGQPGAQIIVRARAEQVLPNCPRYVHPSEVTEWSVYVSRPGRVPRASGRRPASSRAHCRGTSFDQSRVVAPRR